MSRVCFISLIHEQDRRSGPTVPAPPIEGELLWPTVR